MASLKRKSKRIAGKAPKKYSKKNYSVCPICHEKLVGHKNNKYKCGHKFHKKCIYNWIETLERQELPLTCPVCRAPIKKRKGFQPRTGQNTIDLFS